MATRKSRNTESPTPNSGGESVPTTPTTPATRNKRNIRNRKIDVPEAITIKTEKIDEDEEAVKDVKDMKDNDNEDERLDGKDINTDIKNDNTTVKEKDTITTGRKRRITAVKEEPIVAPEKPTASDTSSPATTDDGKTSPTKTKRARRSAIEILMESKPITPKIGKRRNSTGKIEKPARKLSSRIKKLKQMRKANMKRTLLKKPDKVNSAINKPLKQLIEKLDPKQTKKGKSDKNADSASDSELLKISRRRSDSVSKCSDMTDTSSFQENKETDDLTPTNVDQPKIEIKNETVDKDDECTIPSKVESVSNESVATLRSANDSGIGGESDNSQTTKVLENDDGKRPQRRLRRKTVVPALPLKVMNTRSRSDTPNKLENIAKTAIETDESVEDQTSPKDIKKESLESPLHIETIAEPSDETSEKQQTNVENIAKTEKAESLSPVLVSEGVSEISVKQFYGRPDFLENNLGIEEDPKLGEMVQVQEKIKNDNVDDDGADNVNGNDDKKCEMIMGEKKVTKIITHSDVDVQIINESKIVSNNDVTANKGAKCDDTKKDDDCFVRPEQLRKNSLLNENLLLNGEIEVRPKDKNNISKKYDMDVGDVVLFTITQNGQRVNPEKLEKILENQKLKEMDEPKSLINDKNTDKDIEIVEKTESKPNGNVGKDDCVHVNEKTVPNDSQKQIILYDSTITKIGEEKLTKTPVKQIESILIEDNDTESVHNQVEEDVNTVEVDMEIDSIEAKENIDKTNQLSDSSASIGNKDSRSSSIDDETMEDRMQKESHLKTLGLLTLQAAVEASIETQKRREQLKATIASSSHGSKAKKNAEYTGTLKTVIKLQRNDNKKKGNLKMTLHKGRPKNGGSGSDKGDSNSAGNSEEDTYYTIQNPDIDGIDCSDALAEEAAGKEYEKLLVIPEKASSFRYHPEKLCEDQCFYCGGKFGLFDTPCHVAQIKSAERQKKILDNEEKLTVDSCLCDACFRHVDRRANCPSYKKRLSAPAPMNDFDVSAADIDDKTLQQNAGANESALFQTNKDISWCLVQDCKEQASHSIRRKWAIKVRKSVSKSIPINFENTNSMTFLPICDKHYEDMSHLMICALCNIELKRNHSFFINQDSNKIEPLLASEGIPVTIAPTSVLCKLCRYYLNLLLKPNDTKKTEVIKNYTKRLLNYHKSELIDDDSETEQSRKEQNEQEQSSKRARVPKRGRKSTPELSTPSSATNSDDGNPKQSKSIGSENDATMDSSLINQDSSTINLSMNRPERQRQRNKQLTQQKLLAEQQRVEQRVLQEQMKLKQQELLEQQKQQEEIREQQLRASNEDISNLRTNPNISMRELFPGEEEMGLNVNIPFTAGSWRTPEGWTKVTSTVQYDEATRRLWEELQKPYGTQSSFLRHLILLEKYFRNGDLLLAPGANLNAVTYAESVQQRLQSYDNISPRPISLSQIVSDTSVIPPAPTTIIDLSQTTTKTLNVPNSAVTITKAVIPSNVIAVKPVTNVDSSNSLLKSNATTSTTTRRTYTVTTEPIISEKNQQSHSSNISNNNTSINSTPLPKNKPSIGLPPELICINTSTPNDKHQQQLLSQQLYQAQMQLTLQQHLQAQHQSSLLLTQHNKLQQQILQNNAVIQPITQAQVQSGPPPKKHQASHASTSTTANAGPSNNQPNICNNKTANVIRLPDTLTESERRESKHWRPTLMAVSAGKNHTNNEVYQTADGRRLPHLVQVQSAGKPYLISIHDYNRMCILRRERLLRDQEQMLKIKQQQPSAQQQSALSLIVSKQSKPTATVTSGLLATVATTLANAQANGVLINETDKIQKSSTNTSNSIAKKVQIPNKILEQNSLIPITSSKSNIDNSNDSLLKVRKNQSSLLKTNAVNQAKLIPVPPVPPNATVTATVVPSNTAKLPLSLSQSNVVSITSTPSISAILAMNSGTPTSTPPPIQLVQQPITITSVSSLPLANTAHHNVSALEALFKTTNQVTTTPTTMWQWAESLNKNNSAIGITPIDTSTKSILSKIPKSLTVIPQQKRLSSKGSDDM